MKKRIIALLLCLLLAGALTLSAGAAAPDLTAQGSITVTLKHREEALSGGSLTFYRVAAITEQDGNYAYAWTEEYAGANLTLKNLQSAELPRALQDYVRAQKLSGDSRTVQNGAVSYAVPAEKLGLYLVVQQEACDGYGPINPFLIGVPNFVDGAYVYAVQAAPKTGGLTPDPDDPGPAEPDDKPDDKPALPVYPKPVPPVSPKPALPQTGQLNWPIPVLAAAGLILFTAGWALTRRKQSGKCMKDGTACSRRRY